MTKHGIRPPRKPKGENLKVTIANQDRQIKLLINRCEQLSSLNGQLEHALRERSESNAGAKLAAREAAYTRLLGWQDCAREILIGSVKPFPSNAPGV